MTEEDYLLVCLAEECAEVAHAVSKSLRFGLGHPWPGRLVATNRDAVREELRDLMRVAERLKLMDFSGLPDKGAKFDSMVQLSRTLGRIE